MDLEKVDRREVQVLRLMELLWLLMFSVRRTHFKREPVGFETEEHDEDK
jgi:hypothetical protein